MAVYIENFRNRVIKKLNFSHYNGEEERTETIPAGGSTCLKQLKENIEYTVGIHADVTEVLFVKVFREFSENLKRPHQKGISKAE